MNLKTIIWDEAKKTDKYYYNGNNDTPNKILNMFQNLATNENNEERNIVSLQYCGYNCDLDIFWEEADNKNVEMKLVVGLFLTYDNDTVNSSEVLLLSDICKPNYLENKMYNFILDCV